jgi:hypothetical protein
MPQSEEDLYEQFCIWMAERINQTDFLVGKRGDAVWWAKAFMQVEESDGQFGHNNQLTLNDPKWQDKSYAYRLADEHLQRKKNEDLEG